MFDPRGVLRLILSTAHGDRQIARLRGCSASTVGRYRKLALKFGLTLGELEAMSDSEIRRRFNPAKYRATKQFAQPDWATVLLKVKEGLHLIELHEAYVGEHPEDAMSYRAFCRAYSDHVGASHPIMRQKHTPGGVMMVDFAGYRPMGRTDHNGAPVSFELFVAVLPASDYTFACAVRSQNTADFLWANEQALRFFRGAPEGIVSDNLKAAVLSHPRSGKVRLNPAFEDFCDHHALAARPARPYRPTHKAKVELGVKFVQRLLRLELRDRPLPTLNDINTILKRIVETLNGRRLRRLPNETRRSLYEKLELPRLRPLAASPYTFFEVRRGVRVGPDYHVVAEAAHYSVPHQLIGQSIDVRAGTVVVEIWHDGKQIAVHPRLEAGGVSTLPSHMPPNHLARRAIEERDLELWARLEGPAVQELARHEAATGLSGAAKASVFRSFKDLARKVGSHRLEAACARAIALGMPRLSHVRNTLERGLEFADPPCPTNISPTATGPNENVRGADYFGGA